MNARRFTVHMLMIAALVLAGISPACAFISGKANLFEICAADGSVKQAELDSDLALFITAKQDQAPDDHHEKRGDDCAFCFAQTHLKTFKTASLALTPPALALTAAPVFDKQAAGIRYLASHPRGPPAIS